MPDHQPAPSAESVPVAGPVSSSDGASKDTESAKTLASEHTHPKQTDSRDEAFGSLARVYGRQGFDELPQLRICVVGIGGVGSWAVEALARTGVGHITMIDHDDVSTSNINRQLHALHTTVNKSKVEIMRERLLLINPTADIVAEDDFLAEKNLAHYLERDFDVVIDAIDNIRFKVAAIAHCKRNKIRIITTGGAGGRVDPLQVGVADLSRTWNDALAAKVRSRLRSDYGFTSNPKRRFGIECVYSSEQPLYPDSGGEVSHTKPGVAGARLDCDQGYGSVAYVTGTFGLVAASRAVNRALAQRLRNKSSALDQS